MLSFFSLNQSFEGRSGTMPEGAILDLHTFHLLWGQTTYAYKHTHDWGKWFCRQAYTQVLYKQNVCSSGTLNMHWLSRATKSPAVAIPPMQMKAIISVET